MPIAFPCQQCGENYKVADTLAGKKIKCRKCHAVVSVPGPQAAKPASTVQPAKAKSAGPAVAKPDSVEPALDLLSASLEPLATPTNPLFAAGPGYAPQAAPKGRVKPKPAQLRGPGVVQSMMMFGGTALLVVVSAGVYAGAARFLPKRVNVAAPKTGAEAVGGMPKGPIGSPSTGIPPAKTPSDDEDWDE